MRYFIWKMDLQQIINEVYSHCELVLKGSCFSFTHTTTNITTHYSQVEEGNNRKWLQLGVETCTIEVSFKYFSKINFPCLKFTPK